MLGCLTELAKPYVEKLINGTAAELSYICCFTCIAKDFEEEKARLEPIRTTIKQRIDVAIKNGEDVQAIAHSWEEEVDKLIQEDTKTKQKCFFELCPHCLWRYKRGKLLANEKEDIKKLIEGAMTLEIGIPVLLPGVELYSSQNYMHFKSRESKYKELLVELKDDNNYIIGLQGLGGTGKTTLIKEVGKQLKNSKQFTHIPFTTVSLFPNIKKIQDDIAGSLGLKLDGLNESDRPKRLWSRLTNGEKILLILDDVWDYIDFNDIGIPYSDNCKGCRIIVTTRKMGVCNKFQCNKTIQLDLLSEEDAWIMFKRHADPSENLLDKGRKIANECKRLPIAIAVIASSLKGEKRRDEWDVTLKSLQKHLYMTDVEEDRVKIYQCLRFSYDNMKDKKVRGLFLLCSVFREDEDIDIEILVRLAIAGCLFGEDYVSYEDARSQVVKSINKLLDSCLLFEVKHRGVKMHDLVRDAAQWIAKKEIQTVQVYNKNQKVMVEREKNVKYLLCEGNPKDVFSCKFGGSKLEILIVILNLDKDYYDEKIELPDSFFGNNIGLRVLDLLCSGAFRGALSLPHSMQSLKNIRSLIIGFCDLGDISILGNLQSLETLDLVLCHINELPHEITKLEKFRLLKLECCEIRRNNNPFEVIEKCSSLEELYFTSFNAFCQEINFPKLQRFYVVYGTDFVDDSFKKYVSLESSGYRDEICLSETTLKFCMQEAEILRLKLIEGEWKNIMPDIIPLEHGMNDMVELSLGCISQLQCLIDTMHTNSLESNVFCKLAVLTLGGMENLEELCNGPLSFDSLKSLEKLSIKDCKHLRNLFKCNLSLCNLKEVSLVGCPMLISIFELSTAKWEGSRREIVEDDSRSRDPMFLKLKVLKIKECPQFELILPFVSAHDLPALESIEMKRCDKLKYIFGQDVKLGSLQNIKLGDVPNLIDIFPEGNSTMSLSIKRSSFISKDSSNPPNQSDPIKCNLFSWSSKLCGKKLRNTTSTESPLINENQPQDNSTESNSDCLNINIWERAQCLSRQSMILCNVKKIELTQLRKIKSVFILSIAPRMLLETLKIEDCDELKHVIIDTRDHDNSSGGNNLGNVFFPKLKMLSIENCIQLEYIFGRYTYDNQNHIEVHLHLPALEHLFLENLPSLVAICPKQYYTTFPPLKRLALENCLQVAHMKPIGDFIPHHSAPKSIDGTFTKELSGNIECLLALERLRLNKSKVESIFCINEINEQPMNSALQRIQLENLYVTSCLFVGPRNSFALQNLITIKIVRCEKLQVIFSDSILKCLPQLFSIILIECDELMHIIEDDLEDKNMSNSLSSRTCFPKLNVLVVEKCNKLKCVFPVSICNELPKLNCLIIREAYELEEIFKSEGEEIEKVKIPNLKFVAIMNLPSLFQTQRIQFQHVEYLFVMDCQKLSLTSASIPDSVFKIFDEEARNSDKDIQAMKHLSPLLAQLKREFKGRDTGIETTKDFVAEIEVEAASRHELEGSTSEKSTGVTMSTILETKNETPKQKGIEISVEQGTTYSNVKPTTSATHLELTSLPVAMLNSEELMNEHSTSPLGATDATVKFSQENNLGIEISVEEGITSSNVKTVTSLTNLELEYDGQIDTLTVEDVVLGDSQETAQTNNQVSLSDDHAFMKESSIIEEKFPKGNKIIVSKSKRSSFESQFLSALSQGDSSQIVEDFGSSLLVPTELEQLVSEKHLHIENLSLLTDFLVKHPSLLLRDTSLSKRYKGCAYNFLAELLKFLQTHSVLDALGSSHSEFVELLQDARRFPFNKEWLDVVEKRVLFPGLQVSQTAFQKLLDSKHIMTEHVKDLKHQLASSEAVLESITQQEAHILETRAALSHPIGY